MALTIRFNSMEKIGSWFKNMSRSLNSAVRDTGLMLTHEAENNAKERILSSKRKPGKGTGGYFRSIRSDFKHGSVSYTGTLKSHSPIADVIEFGSRPHIIRPRDSKFLFWFGAKHPVKEVNHPGTPSFRVLGDAVENAVQQSKDK